MLASLSRRMSPVQIRYGPPRQPMRCWSCPVVLASPSNWRSRVRIPHSAPRLGGPNLTAPRVRALQAHRNHGDVAHQEERRVRTAKAAGSSPAVSTTSKARRWSGWSRNPSRERLGAGRSLGGSIPSASAPSYDPWCSGSTPVFDTGGARFESSGVSDEPRMATPHAPVAQRESSGFTHRRRRFDSFRGYRSTA